MIAWTLLADLDDHGMMDGGHNWGWMWLWGVVMLAVVVAVVVLVVWLVSRTAGSPTAGVGPVPPTDPNWRAREILGERLARGEIDAEEYQTRLSHLR
jgi:putative membrane protein